MNKTRRRAGLVLTVVLEKGASLFVRFGCGEVFPAMAVAVVALNHIEVACLASTTSRITANVLPCSALVSAHVQRLEVTTNVVEDTTSRGLGDQDDAVVQDPTAS